MHLGHDLQLRKFVGGVPSVVPSGSHIDPEARHTQARECAEFGQSSCQLRRVSWSILSILCNETEKQTVGLVLCPSWFSV